MIRAGACTLLALLAACGTRTQLSSDPTGTVPVDGEGGTGGGALAQVDPSCVPTPCIAPCTGELLSASTIVFADVDVQAVSVGDDAVFMAGNGVFMAENAGFLMQASREGAARWTTTFEPSWDPPMAVAPTGAGDVHLCRASRGTPGSRGATVDRFDASGELVAALPRGAYSSCAVEARADDLFVITSGVSPSDDGGNSLQVTAYAGGDSVRWSQPLSARIGPLFSSLSPDGDLAVGYRALGEAGVVPRITVFGGDGTASWQVDLRSENQAAQLTDVAFAPNGELVVMGRLSGIWEVDFGGGVFSGSDHHLFLARYSPDGALRWARAFPLPDLHQFDGHALTIDPNGHAVLVGLTTSSRDLVGNPLEGAGDRGGVVFAEKLDDCGNHLWSSVAGTVADGGPRPFVGADATGRVVAVTTGLSSTGHEVLFATFGP